MSDDEITAAFERYRRRGAEIARIRALVSSGHELSNADARLLIEAYDDATNPDVTGITPGSFKMAEKLAAMLLEARAEAEALRAKETPEQTAKLDAEADRACRPSSGRGDSG